MQPINLSGKQVEDLPEQFPFWLCSYIRHQERATFSGESSEVKVPFSGASKYESRSESEHVSEASLT